MYSGPVTIYQRDGWQLDSYGNGAAYALRDTESGMSLFVQGDDAATFRDEFDSAFDHDRVADCFEQYRDVMESDHGAH